MKYITSRDNQLVKHASSLKLKKHRQQEKMFFIEGDKLLQEALRDQDAVVRIFIDENVFPDFAGDLPAGIECCVLKAGLINYISDTDTPPGMGAVVKMPSYNWEQFYTKGHLLYLDHLSDPGNLGTIIRTAWALGVEGILLSPGCVDPFSPKVVRASMGGIFNMPLYHVDEGQVDQLIVDGFRFIGAAAAGTATSVYEADLTGKTIIAIGSEARGLSPSTISRLHNMVKIPIEKTVDSLNAGVACAIILAEAWQQKRAVP
ncbi:TrmH family RNA methyltransferase [Syntrophomonas erecta]